MERSGSGGENEGVLYAMHIKQQFDSSGIASLVLKKKKKKVQRCRPPNSDLVHIDGGLLVFSKRSLVFADLTAPARLTSVCGRLGQRCVG